MQLLRKKLQQHESQQNSAKQLTQDRPRKSQEGDHIQFFDDQPSTSRGHNASVKGRVSTGTQKKHVEKAQTHKKDGSMKDREGEKDRHMGKLGYSKDIEVVADSEDESESLVSQSKDKGNQSVKKKLKDGEKKKSQVTVKKVSDREKQNKKHGERENLLKVEFESDDETEIVANNGKDSAVQIQVNKEKAEKRKSHTVKKDNVKEKSVKKLITLESNNESKSVAKSDDSGEHKDKKKKAQTPKKDTIKEKQIKKLISVESNDETESVANEGKHTAEQNHKNKEKNTKTEQASKKADHKKKEELRVKRISKIARLSSEQENESRRQSHVQE